MIEPVQKSSFWRKRWVKPAIAIAVIILGTILALRYAPPEGEANNVTGDLPETPTVGITDLLDTLSVNRQLDYQGVHITLSRAMLATKFSNDHKRTGTYTIRIEAQTKNNVQQAVGLEYAQLLTLLLPDGSKVKTKLVSIKAVQLPETPQSGFFDFPVPRQVSLKELKLQFDQQTIIPLGS